MRHFRVHLDDQNHARNSQGRASGRALPCRFPRALWLLKRIPPDGILMPGMLTGTHTSAPQACADACSLSSLSMSCAMSWSTSACQVTSADISHPRSPVDRRQNSSHSLCKHQKHTLHTSNFIDKVSCFPVNLCQCGPARARNFQNYYGTTTELLCIPA